MQVLHIRNLPYDVEDEELKELCTPFGRLVHIMVNLGQNKNQALVEFSDRAGAMKMVSHFENSGRPAMVSPLAPPQRSLPLFKLPLCLTGLLRLFNISAFVACI